MTPAQALAKAIHIAGGAPVVAQKLKITPQAINQWDRCPADRVAALLALVRRAQKQPVPTKHDLRPDLFAADGRAATESISPAKPRKGL